MKVGSLVRDLAVGRLVPAIRPGIMASEATVSLIATSWPKSIDHISIETLYSIA